MAYFEWASDMVIDHDGPIDQDHRRLVAQVNRLHDATSQGSGQEIVAGLLEELLADTKEHLAHEERFMASVGFPESEAHRKGHDRFVAELVRLKELYESGSPTVATRLPQLLRDWLSLHIRRNDKEVRLFLDKQRRLKALKKS